VTGRIASWALRRAIETLPLQRRTWGQAMRAELDHVGDGKEALLFALGCLVAAFAERIRSITGPEAARLAFAAATLGLAAFHLNCAADGVRILAGGADPFHASLLRSGPAFRETAELWRAATPLLTLGFGALGLANLAASVSAALAKRAAFANAFAAALAIALLQAVNVLAVLGLTAGLQTFLAFIGLQAALSSLLWRFAMNEQAARRL
jgi:hypothetical protein